MIISINFTTSPWPTFYSPVFVLKTSYSKECVSSVANPFNDGASVIMNIFNISEILLGECTEK